MTQHDNTTGWVIASMDDCPSRIYWRHMHDDVWTDTHGCKINWDDLVDPIDCLAPHDIAERGW